MFYRKNLPGWERTMRAVGGIVMIAYGLLGMPGTMAGYLIAAGGADRALHTGFGVDAGLLTARRIHLLVAAAGRTALHVGPGAAADLRVGRGALRQYRADKQGRHGDHNRRGFH